MANGKRLTKEEWENIKQIVEQNEKLGLGLSFADIGKRCEVGATTVRRVWHYRDWDAYVEANKASRMAITQERTAADDCVNKDTNFTKSADDVLSDLSILARIQNMSVTELKNKILADYTATYAKEIMVCRKLIEAFSSKEN